MAKAPKQKSVLYLDSQPVRVAGRVPSSLSSDQWRLTAREPTNAAYQGHLIRALKLSYKFVPKKGEDPKSVKIKEIVEYYEELFAKSSWDLMKVTWEKDSYDLPFGGALEVGWWPDNAFGGKFPAGYPAWFVHVDAGTMRVNQASSNGKFPFCQIDPNNTQHIIPFKRRDIARLLYLPHTDIKLRGYQNCPTEQNWQIIQALSRLYTYDMKSLTDTPIAGILDLADFSEEDAIEWAKGFQEMMMGIEAIKIPILYEHERPARFVPFGNVERNTKEQWKHYAEKCGNPYGLTIGSLGLYEHDRTLAGARIQRITTQRTGVGGFAWDEKHAINRQLFPPDCPVRYDWDVPEIEDVVKRRQAEGIRIAYLGQAVDKGALKPEDMLEQMVEDDIFTIPVKPGAIQEGITGPPKPPKQKEVPPKAPKPGGKYPEYPAAEKAAHIVENTLLLKQDVGDDLEQTRAFKDMQEVLTNLFTGLASKNDISRLVGEVYRGKSEVVEMGSERSGHWGHRGRKGKRGGSLSKGAKGMFRTFDSRDEAHEYAMENLSGPEAEARGIERDAMWYYTGDGWANVNFHLRGQREDVPKKAKRAIEGLDKMLARDSAVLQEGIVVKREFGWKFFDDKPVGTVFKDRAFVSTTVNPETRHYRDGVDLHVPKGVRAAYVYENSFKGNEMELLLNRDLTFRVVKNDDSGVAVEVL